MRSRWWWCALTYLCGERHEKTVLRLRLARVFWGFGNHYPGNGGSGIFVGIFVMTIWPFPTELPPAIPMKRLPFNPENYEDSPL